MKHVFLACIALWVFMGIGCSETSDIQNTSALTTPVEASLDTSHYFYDYLFEHPYLKRADSLYNKGQYKAAQLAYQKSALQFASEAHWEGNINALNKMGVIYGMLHEKDSAEKYIGLALARGKQYLNHPDHPCISYSHFAYGYFYSLMGMAEESLAAYQKALASTRRLYNRPHLWEARILLRMGFLSNKKLKDYEKAQKYLKQGRETLEKLPKEKNKKLLTKSKLLFGDQL